jgi:hypothetical protein
LAGLSSITRMVEFFKSNWSRSNSSILMNVLHMRITKGRFEEKWSDSTTWVYRIFIGRSVVEHSVGFCLETG